jgi:hypothetical protein
MSLLETATRAGSRRRMGMRLLHRLMLLMAYFINRLGDTGHVSLLVSGGFSLDLVLL